MPGSDGRPGPWIFQRPGEAAITVLNEPRIAVNDLVTIHRLVVNGAGIGVLSGYLCAPDIAAGRLVRLFAEWQLLPLDVSLVFPSSRELSVSVRAFVTYMKAVSAVGLCSQDDILAVSRPVAIARSRHVAAQRAALPVGPTLLHRFAEASAK